MSSRLTLWFSALLRVALGLRALPFVWWPAVHFDSHQATIGLMSKHISKGRAFPLFTYAADLDRPALSAPALAWPWRFGVLNTLDVVALAREYRSHPPADLRQVATNDLERRGTFIARSRLRDAYHITFLAQERVRISATDFSRIQAYADEASRTDAPMLSERSCDGGQALHYCWFICR